MGTYTSFSLDGYELVSSKSAVVPEVMTIFRETDRKTYRVRIEDDARDTSGETADEVTQDEANDFEDVIEYSTNVQIACQRLDIMGFTLERSKREYERIRMELFEQYSAEEEENRKRGEDASADTFYAEQVGQLRRLTIERYMFGFMEVLTRRLHSYELSQEQAKELDETLRYILVEDHYDWTHFGFFCHDVRLFLRVALSLAPPDSMVTQDVSSLISAGWLTPSQPVCDDAIHSLVERYPENAPRIVLTEGSSDADILMKALSVLFPHLMGYFTFFDFHGSRAAGGASQLIGVVKAFAASGVANRVVAVLDNDTAGREARRALNDIRLPENLAVVHCPEREWMRNYPTIGPSGTVSLDVNGKAASIELYLGRDVLEENGKLCPVQWAGYSQSMNAYQGELLDKAAVRARWNEKTARCLDDPAQFVEANWADLRAIWEQIFAAFPDRE